MSDSNHLQPSDASSQMPPDSSTFEIATTIPFDRKLSELLRLIINQHLEINNKFDQEQPDWSKSIKTVKKAHEIITAWHSRVDHFAATRMMQQFAKWATQHNIADVTATKLCDEVLATVKSDGDAKEVFAIWQPVLILYIKPYRKKMDSVNKILIRYPEEEDKEAEGQIEPLAKVPSRDTANWSDLMRKLSRV
jgi:hypothetical protein